MHVEYANCLFSAGRPTGTVSTKGENINISWSPDGHTIAVGNKVYLLLLLLLLLFLLLLLRRIY